MCEIQEWKEIEAEFREGLIIGNGASIAVNARFDYREIYKEAAKMRFISPDIKKVFDHFKKKDFKFVLRLLLHTNLVNNALNVKEKKTVNAQKEVRNALIKTVRHIHPDYKDVFSDISNISDFLKNFKIVASLNYDLIVYWSMLFWIEKNQIKGFMDRFIKGKFDKNLEPWLKENGKAKDATLVFYPHGNLALASNKYDRERKIESSNRRCLLEEILSSWESMEEIPIFVSEGTSKQKLDAIERSPYLRTVYETILPKLGNNIVIYGWKMGIPDSHILKALKKGKVRKIAVSIHKPSVNLQKKVNYFSDRIHEFFKKEQDIEVIFFDSKSKGCWKT